MKIKVSVITVVYNGVSAIERTINNVLKQTYENLEYLIIDGGSTDGTLDVIKKYGNRVKFISEKDKGLYDAMQKGAMLASGEWLIYRNCGDFFFSPDAVSQIFSTYTDCGESFITANCRYFKSFCYKDKVPSILNKHYFESMPFDHPSTFIRREVQLKHPYSLVYKNSSDYCFFIECLQDGSTYLYKNIIVSLFENEEGTSSCNYERSLSENIKILKRFGADDIYVQKIKRLLKYYKLRALIKKIAPFYDLLHSYNLRKQGWIKMPLDMTLKNV